MIPMNGEAMIKFVRATKFGYTEPNFGTYFPSCRDCVYTVSDDGCRHYGMVNPTSFDSKYFGKLCLYCKKQEAFVLPFAKCNAFEG